MASLKEQGIEAKHVEDQKIIVIGGTEESRDFVAKHHLANVGVIAVQPNIFTPMHDESAKMLSMIQESVAERRMMEMASMLSPRESQQAKQDKKGNHRHSYEPHGKEWICRCGRNIND
jgi:hypothetical protein